MREIQEKASGGTNGRERSTRGIGFPESWHWKQLGPESNGEYTHPQLHPNRRLHLQCQLCSYKPEDSAPVIYLARFEFFLSIDIN
jgi:hypothetical protein